MEEQVKMRQAKQAKEERERELRALSDMAGPSGHQKLQVCDVCGAYLSRLDNDRRLADHFYGKMHLGYAQMRKTAEALQRDIKGRPPPSMTMSSQPYGGRDGRDGRDGGRGDDGPASGFRGDGWQDGPRGGGGRRGGGGYRDRGGGGYRRGGGRW